MKNFLGLLMAMLVLFSMAVPVVATEPPVQVYTEVAEETISAFEDELSRMGQSVQSELSELIEVYKAEQMTCIDEVDYQKLQTLIDRTSDLLRDYEAYKNANSLARKPSIAVGTIISTIIAYFQGKNDVLAAELLTQMTFNEKLDSNYSPHYGNNIVRAFGSSVMTPIVNAYASSGSSGFTTKNSCEDLYYAIHLFNWTKRVQGTSKLITIRDRYDFSYNDHYSGIAGTAINFLAIAQGNGEILPFYTVIPLNY